MIGNLTKVNQLLAACLKLTDMSEEVQTSFKPCTRVCTHYLLSALVVIAKRKIYRVILNSFFKELHKVKSSRS